MINLKKKCCINCRYVHEIYSPRKGHKKEMYCVCCLNIQNADQYILDRVIDGTATEKDCALLKIKVKKHKHIHISDSKYVTKPKHVCKHFETLGE